MNKLMKRAAAALLSGLLVLGQAGPALAAQDDSNYGPAFSTKVEQTSPGSLDGQSGDGQSSGPQSVAPANAAPAEQADGVGAAAGSTEAAAGTAGTDGVTSAATDQNAAQAADDSAQADAEAAAAAQFAAEEAARQASANTPFLQIQVLRPDTTWTDPVIGDTPVVSEQGFRSMSVYLNNIVGDILYRTYTSAHGWSDWAMNGGHTTVWEDGALVEAIQMRFNGFVGNTFDIYYCTTLNDGTELNWARNSATAGTMGTGKVLSSFRVSLWGKGVEGASYNMEKPLEAAFPDGIQVVDGAVAYSSGNGVPFTGWAWNDRDRYYFVNNAPVTGWQYIDGFKYYFDETGKLLTDLEPIVGNSGPFLISINKQMNCMTIFAQDGANGFIIPVKTYLTSTGPDTPIGTFQTPAKYRWRDMNHGIFTQYATRIYKGFLIHSILYSRPDPMTLDPLTYNYLGIAESAGCVRLLSGDAKWVYDNCALGTTVTIYNSPKPGPYDRPAIEWVIPGDQHWDPTDPLFAQQQ